MTVVTTIAGEIPETAAAFARVHPDVVRTGVGSGPNAVVNVNLDGVDMYSSYNRFPTCGRATVADDVIVVALFVSAPPGTRWSEIDLTTGDVLVYGPGTQHTWSSPEGIEYRAALIDRWVLDEIADSIQTEIHCPAAGSAKLLNPTAAVQQLASGLHALGSPLAPSNDLPARSSRVLPAVANALAGASDVGGSRRTGVIRSRDVVHECIGYADALGRVPSIPELCTVAHISERRLRAAFYDTFDVAPSVFFRARILSHARDRLLSGDQSVTEVALDVGFEHLGRFAGHYAEVYGEYPHETLAHAQSTADLRAHRRLALPTALGPTAPRLGPLPV